MGGGSASVSGAASCGASCQPASQPDRQKLKRSTRADLDKTRTNVVPAPSVCDPDSSVHGTKTAHVCAGLHYYLSGFCVIVIRPSKLFER